MKIINYSLIFSSFFIITACSSTSPPTSLVPESSKDAIALCTGGYSTETSAGIEAEYKKRNGKIFITKGESESGKLSINGFKGGAAAEIYNTYVKCAQSQYNRSNGGSTSTRTQSPDITLNKGNNSPSKVSINYAT